MKKLFYALALGAGLLSLSAPTSAQDNLLSVEGVTIHTLGSAKSWISITNQTYTFVTDDLSKLIETPTNTTNVMLFPEDQDGGGYVSNDNPNATANKETGIQGFYIDLGQSEEIGTITTTWEGASASSFKIYLTDKQPTLDILTTTPTIEFSGLNSYTSHTFALPSDSKGQFLVFQPTDAANWGWGVKMRSISALAPSDDVLTTFKVTPSIVIPNKETQVTLTFLNQNGLAIPADEVEVDVTSNASYDGEGNLTITSGESATFTAKLNNIELDYTVYAASAPVAPAESDIKTPIYTNTVTTNNSTAEFTVAYNGGATKGGELTFSNGEVAQLFTNTQCVFFSNSVTTGGWNGDINPEEKGYKNLCLDVFSGRDVECTIEFEEVTNLEGGATYTFPLKAGQWNPIKVDIEGATRLANMSIRFTEANIDDILLANIYFSPADYVPSDGYYLATSMTEEYDGGFKPNPSFRFEGPYTEEATDAEGQTQTYYTLTVGSVDQDAKFYVIQVSGNKKTEYSSSSTDTDIAPAPEGVINLSKGSNIMGLNGSYLNVTFKLIVDTTSGAPYVLSFTGTEANSDWTITPGNDQTMQSGTVTTENKVTTIDITTYSDGAYAIIYVPSKYEENSTVWYSVSSSEYNSGATTYAENVKSATIENGCFSVSLAANTQGNISVFTSADATEPAKTFAYTVIKGIPTGIDAVQSSEAAEYYTLQGVKVQNPEKGIFIKVANGKATKVVL